jgi:glycosyltransferase involved in cell wall biosynthesis
LARFCRRHDVEAVFSNLQHANFIAVCAQYLTRARVIAFRHHFKFVFPGDGIPLEPNRMEQIFDKVINRLARTIVVPSRGVYDGMQAVESVDMSRVEILPYMYDFDRYRRPNTEAVSAIRARFPARLTLLMSARLIPFKRHALVFRVIRDLVGEGLDLRMLVLDDGPERESLEGFIKAHGLYDRIIMLGFRRDFVDYMAAADILVHPSLTEASSSVVKEMGLLGRTAIVCEGVGDFDEYLEHGRNAFLVPRATSGSEIAEIIRELHARPERLVPLGRSLRSTVLERFSVERESVDRYLNLARPRR